MIPYDSKTEVCPYRSAEMRKIWHQEKGIKDPEMEEPSTEHPKPGDLEPGKSVQTCTHSVVVPEVSSPPMQEHPERKGTDRRARWREKNREKIAAKAREKRAGKK
jgi:hypothetical protein